MGMKLLGIDVSNKSKKELEKIIDELGLKDLNQHDLDKLMKFPEGMRKHWLDHPEQTGQFTNDKIDTLYNSFIFQQSQMHPVSVYERQISDIITKSLRNKIYLIDEAGDALYEETMERLKEGLDLYSKKTGYTHTDLEAMSYPDIYRDTTYAYIDIGFIDGTKIKDFKFEIPDRSFGDGGGGGAAVAIESSPEPVKVVKKKPEYEPPKPTIPNYPVLDERLLPKPKSDEPDYGMEF